MVVVVVVVTVVVIVVVVHVVVTPLVNAVATVCHDVAVILGVIVEVDV